MGRYATFRPGRDTARPAHWSDGLKPGTLWADLNLQISVDPEQWAHERGIPLDQAREAFEAFVEEIKQETMFKAMGGRVAWGAEQRTGQRD